VTSAEPTRPPAGREPWWTRAYARVEDALRAQRRRHYWFNHLVRAGGRYQRTQGDLMAAGVTYLAFLALFPVLLLAASIFGLFLAGDALLQQQLYDSIREAFPGELGEQLVHEVSSAVGSAGVTGLIGLVGFLYAGLRTVDKLRIGMELIWKGAVDKAEFLRDNLQDMLALVALGGIGVVSLALTGALTQGSSRVLELLGLDGSGSGVLTWLLGLALAVVVDVVIFLWMLRVVPSVSHPLRRLLPGALFGAAGFEVLKVIGGYYLTLISGSVTASAFGGAVGLLVWINLVARFSFFTAAWTATLRRVESASPVRSRDAAPVPA
jgi:membrane protein